MKIVEEMASFVQLWDLVQSVQLSDQKTKSLGDGRQMGFT